MHTKEVICWQCKAPNQVEDNEPELLEALERIAELSTATHDAEYVATLSKQYAERAIQQAKEK